MTKVRQCDWCGRTYRYVRSNSRYCSDGCYRSADSAGVADAQAYENARAAVRALEPDRRRDLKMMVSAALHKGTYADDRLFLEG